MLGCSSCQHQHPEELFDYPQPILIKNNKNNLFYVVKGCGTALVEHFLIDLKMAVTFLFLKPIHEFHYYPCFAGAECSAMAQNRKRDAKGGLQDARNACWGRAGVQHKVKASLQKDEFGTVRYRTIMLA